MFFNISNSKFAMLQYAILKNYIGTKNKISDKLIIILKIKTRKKSAKLNVTNVKLD
jgi:hypothetical protein